MRMLSLCHRILAAAQQAAFQHAPAATARCAVPLAENLQHRRHYSSPAPVPGLFGIQRLQQPIDYLHWARDAEARCLDLIQQVQAAAHSARVVELMDEISNEMCRVYDSAECCRHVHSSREWRQGADAACQHLGRFVAELNHHQGMYNKLRDTLDAWHLSTEVSNQHDTAGSADAMSVATTSDQPTASSSSSSGSSFGPLLTQQQMQEFTPEVVVVGQKLLLDFEKSGIHLPDYKDRVRVQQLMARNGHFSAQFNANLTDPEQLGTCSIPQRLLPRSWHSSSSNSGEGMLGRIAGQAMYQLPLASAPLHHFLSHMPNEDARRQAYIAGHSTPTANLQLLDDIIHTRFDVARLLGFDSYADFRCQAQTLAETPAAALGFLEDLSQQLRPLADAEVEQLQQLKRKHTGNKGAALQAWDVDYYTVQARSALPTAAAAAAAAPYLHLRSVLDGFSDLMSAVLGVQLREVPASPGELWGPGVTKLLVEAEGLGPLGVLYLDVGQEGAPGSVLYPITCGRQQPDGSYQHPVLVLVTSCSSSSTPGEQVLTWRELRTLVHELGHAMHNMLSRTRFQHLWGTRCAHDMVEVPSHLWEHFVTDPRSVALLARHVSSREPLPPQLLQDLLSGQRLLPALELQQQLLLSLLDLTYHGPTPPAPGATSDVLAQLSAEHSSVPFVAGTAPQARFSHLTIYGAGYYTYLYARCLSASLWQLYFEKDPISREAGDLVAKRLLAPGGTIDPLPLLQGLLGTEQLQQQLVCWPGGGWSPQPQHLLQEAVASSSAAGAAPSWD